LLDVEKIQRVGKLAGELLSSGMAKDSQDAMRKAEDMLLKRQDTHLASPFMDNSNSHEQQPMRIKKEEDVDYSIIIRKFTSMVDEQKREVEALKAMISRMQKDVEEIKYAAPRRYEAPAPAMQTMAPQETSAPASSYIPQPQPLTGFGENVAVSRSVPTSGAPTRQQVPIIGPDGKPFAVQPRIGGGDNIPTVGNNPRSGDYKSSDVSIEKFFYSGSKKR